MELTALFEELGTSMGIDRLTFDADGQCYLLFDGAHEVTFLHNQEDHALIMYCELGKLSAQADDICRELMQASLLGAETGGAALSVDSRLDVIVLWKRHDESFDSLPFLEQALNAFLTQAIQWKARLGPKNASRSEEKPIDSNLLNNFDMFV